MAKLPNKSLKTKIIEQLYAVFAGDNEDMQEDIILMNSILKTHSLTFKEPKEIDPVFFLINVSDIESCFYEAINSKASISLPHFAIQCEAYIDFTPVIKKDNDHYMSLAAQTHNVHTQYFTL